MSGSDRPRPSPALLACVGCRKKLEPQDGKGRKRHYCSGKCKQKAYRKRQKRNAETDKKALRNSLIQFSQNTVEWYTPEKYVAAVTEVLGRIELDPASCQAANLTVKAERFFDVETDGLAQEWVAATVFLNPPYCKQKSVSNQALWTQRLIASYEAGHVQEAILLVNASTETAWFHRLYAYTLCFVKGRISFYTQPGRSTTSHTTGSVFVYFGRHQDKFAAVFQQFGVIVPATGAGEREIRLQA